MEHENNSKVKLSGKELLKLRSQHNMTQEQLESISGVPRLVIDRIEKESTKIYSEDTLNNLAMALETDPQNLVDETQISLKAMVRNSVYNLLIQKKFCTQSDFQEELQAHGIELGTSAVLRVVLTELVKNDPHVKRVRRGCYQYDEITQEDFDKIEKAVISIIKEAVRFDWINSSDKDFSSMRDKVKMVRHFYDTLSQEFSSINGIEQLLGRQ